MALPVTVPVPVVTAPAIAGAPVVVAVESVEVAPGMLPLALVVGLALALNPYLV